MALLRVGIESLTFLTSDSPDIAASSYFLCTVHLTGGYKGEHREREFAKCSRFLQNKLVYIFLTNTTVIGCGYWIVYQSGLFCDSGEGSEKGVRIIGLLYIFELTQWNIKANRWTEFTRIEKSP